MPKSPTDITKFPPKNPNLSGNLALVKTGPESCPFRRLLSRWLDSCRIDGLSERTLHDYQDKLTKFLWWWEEYTGYAREYGAHPKFLTTPMAREFAAYLKEQVPDRWGITDTRNNKQRLALSPASIASYGRSVKVFFNWLEREEFIPKSPFNKSVKFSNRHKTDKVIRYIGPADLARIFEILTEPEKLGTYLGLRNLAIVAMLVDSGIRRGELLSLRLSDIELGQGRCIVRGKTGQRVALFGEACRRALTRYLSHPFNQEFKEESALWRREDGYPLSLSGFDTFIQQLKKECGVEFHAHKLRHTFATLMAGQGVGAWDLKEMLGHTSIATTQIYVASNVDRLQEVYRPHSPLNQLTEQKQVRISQKGRPRREK
jgi:site-specific recombinase XerD